MPEPLRDIVFPSTHMEGLKDAIKARVDGKVASAVFDEFRGEKGLTANERRVVVIAGKDYWWAVNPETGRRYLVSDHAPAIRFQSLTEETHDV